MDNESNDCCWKSLVVACRCFGIITALVLWGVGVEYVYYGTVFGIYFIAIAIVTSFLEVVFLLNPIVEVCVSEVSDSMHNPIETCRTIGSYAFLRIIRTQRSMGQPSLFMRVWDVILSFDDWKKGGLYFILFAPPCFVKPAEVMLGILTGCLLIVTGILYMLKTFKTRRDEENFSVLQNTSYDRFNETQEDGIEDDIVNPTNSPGSGMTSVADQSEILDL